MVVYPAAVPLSDGNGWRGLLGSSERVMIRLYCTTTFFWWPNQNIVSPGPATALPFQQPRDIRIELLAEEVNNLAALTQFDLGAGRSAIFACPHDQFRRTIDPIIASTDSRSRYSALSQKYYVTVLLDRGIYNLNELETMAVVLSQ